MASEAFYDKVRQRNPDALRILVSHAEGKNSSSPFAHLSPDTLCNLVEQVQKSLVDWSVGKWGIELPQFMDLAEIAAGYDTARCDILGEQ